MSWTRMVCPWLTLSILFVGSACQPAVEAPPDEAARVTSENTTDQPESAAHPHVALLLAYEDAFNNEDVPGMLALAHDEIEWISIGAGELSVETSGKEALAASMESYFQSVDTRATVEGTLVNGRFVSFVERVFWTTSAGEEKTQASSAIAEVVDGKLRRLSYYPAQP